MDIQYMDGWMEEMHPPDEILRPARALVLETERKKERGLHPSLLPSRQSVREERKGDLSLSFIIYLCISLPFGSRMMFFPADESQVPVSDYGLYAIYIGW